MGRPGVGVDRICDFSTSRLLLLGGLGGNRDSRKHWVRSEGWTMCNVRCKVVYNNVQSEGWLDNTPPLPSKNAH